MLQVIRKIIENEKDCFIYIKIITISYFVMIGKCDTYSIAMPVVGRNCGICVNPLKEHIILSALHAHVLFSMEKGKASK